MNADTVLDASARGGLLPAIWWVQCHSFLRVCQRAMPGVGTPRVFVLATTLGISPAGVAVDHLECADCRIVSA